VKSNILHKDRMVTAPTLIAASKERKSHNVMNIKGGCRNSNSGRDLPAEKYLVQGQIGEGGPIRSLQGRRANEEERK
jgi:hypothetical protein